MNDRALSLLEQYDIEVLRTRKGRGTFICDTKQGSLVFQEYSGNPEKLNFQQVLLKRIKELDLVKSEELIPNREGQLFVRDGDGVCYILKTYFEGNECDIYDSRQCAEAIQLLARLHHCMDDMELPTGLLPAYSPLQEYEKHNRELTRAWSYLKKKGQKQVFEMRLSGVIEYFIWQARQVTESWKQLERSEESDYTKGAAQPQIVGTSGQSVRPAKPAVGICHGDYQYHNILHCQDGWRIINFEKLKQDDPIQDVYLFLRKVMEKNHWPVYQGLDLLEAYEAIRNLNEYSKKDLYHRFAYPEKFWKIVNFYYNAPKAWIPEKNLEKLEKVICQEKAKMLFLKEAFLK